MTTEPTPGTGRDTDDRHLADVDGLGAEYLAQLDTGSAALDQVVNDLWGLSEDLIRAVVWLADHWPDDLPPLCWYAFGGQDMDLPAVKVQAYCRPRDLARAAELLGVDPVDTPLPGGRTPWRRAVRDFGQVRIEAFHSLGPLARLSWSWPRTALTVGAICLAAGGSWVAHRAYRRRSTAR